MSERAGRWLQRPAVLALVVYVGAVLALTLRAAAPNGGLQDFHRALVPLVSAVTLGQAQISLDEAEGLANVLLFLPIGLLVPLAASRVRPALVLLGASVLSLGVEGAQRVLLPDRSPTLLDVLFNVGGAAIGLVLALEVLTAHERRRRRTAVDPPP